MEFYVLFYANLVFLFQTISFLWNMHFQTYKVSKSTVELFSKIISTTVSFGVIYCSYMLHSF